MKLKQLIEDLIAAAGNDLNRDVIFFVDATVDYEEVSVIDIKTDFPQNLIIKLE